MLQTQKNEPASKPNLGHVVVSAVPEAASHPKRLRPQQPRRRHLQPRMLGRNSHDAEAAQIASMRQKERTSIEAETAWVPCLPWACLCLCQPRTPSDLGRNSLDADTAPKQFGFASPPGVPPHNFPRGPHNVSRDLLSIGANNRRVRHHTDKGQA